MHHPRALAVDGPKIPCRHFQPWGTKSGKLSCPVMSHPCEITARVKPSMNGNFHLLELIVVTLATLNLAI
ncbi:hypothetical protein V8352_06340 [Roseovarius sp. D0-M9]